MSCRSRRISQRESILLAPRSERWSRAYCNNCGSSPSGQTPAATLYSAILREIKTKGKDARFKKSDRGLFVING